MSRMFMVPPSSDSPAPPVFESAILFPCWCRTARPCPACQTMAPRCFVPQGLALAQGTRHAQLHLSLETEHAVQARRWWAPRSWTCRLSLRTYPGVDPLAELRRFLSRALPHRLAATKCALQRSPSRRFWHEPV